MQSNSRILTLACLGLVSITLHALADDDKLRDLGTNAAPGEIPKWDGSQWRNAHDDITTVLAGPGLTGGGSNTMVSVSVAFAGPGSSNTVPHSDFVMRVIPPVGGVIAWMNGLTNVPQQLPDGWVRCDGQLLNDTNSILHGITIPNLNGNGGHIQRFLRGATTSGTAGGSETHTHELASSMNQAGPVTEAEGGAKRAIVTWDNTQLGMTTTTNLPSFYEVVWIMRIK